MLRALCLSIVASLFCMTCPAWATHAEGNAPAAPLSPWVQFRFAIASSLPAGSILTCKAEIVPSPNVFGNGAAPIAAASARTILRGASAICALEIPFSWTGNRASRALALRYEIDAATPAGGVVLQRGLSPAVSLASSPAGPVVNLNFVAAP
jgi:hypothetical protein